MFHSVFYHRPKQQRSIGLSFLFIGLLAGLTSGICLALVHASDLDDVTSLIFMGGLVGLMMGVFVAPVGALCLRNKKLEHIGNSILIATLTATVLSSFAFSSVWTFLIPPVVLVASTIVLYFILPDEPLVGSCVTCNYDLTGNVSGTCPECGTPIEKENQEATSQTGYPLVQLSAAPWSGMAFMVHPTPARTSVSSPTCPLRLDLKTATRLDRDLYR